MKIPLVFMRTSMVLLLFFVIQNTNAQQYKVQKLGVKEGICHPFVYSINQDKNGFIWACTGTGLCRFDGFKFSHTINTTDSLPESVANVSFKDKNSNLWFGHSDGSIVVYNGRKIDILKPDTTQPGSITCIISDSKGNTLVATQSSGIILIDQNLKKSNLKNPFQGKLIYSLCFASDNELLVGTGNGIDIYSYNEAGKIKFLSTIAGLPQTKINFITRHENSNFFWVGTEDGGFFKITSSGKNKYTVENVTPVFHLENANVQSISEDKTGNLWVSTLGKGLYKYSLSPTGDPKDFVNYNKLNGLGQDDIKNSFQDREGNIWIGTFGGGLANLLNESFVSFDFKKELKDNNVLAVCYDKDGYWLAGNGTLIKKKNDKTSEVYTKAFGLPLDNITSLLIDKFGNLWIGTNKNGVYQLMHGAKRITRFFKADNSLGNSVNTIAGKDNDVYVGTKNGIYQFNLKTKVQNHFSTSDRLPHNDIHHIFFDSKNNVWVATRSNTVFALNNDTLRHTIETDAELEFNAITQDGQGNLWIATNGNGVFRIKGKSLLNFSTRQGLKADYCYSITADKYGNVWVGHRLGLSRINSKTNKIKTYGSEYISGDINPNAVAQNADGNMLFGTTDGLILYESSKDQKSLSAPMVNITSVIINDKIYDASQKIVLPYSNYRVRIEYIGLNYSNAEQVTYQYKLDGFDIENSAAETTANREARYPRLSDGNYTFQVKACSGDGVCSETPVTIEIQINKPFWKTWWFLSFSVIALVLAVYLIIIIREKKQKTFQAYLERLLDERTKEVREQKEEIELKNRDITDSINYAQRIQASILPSLRKLQHVFTGSFVYYQPRDIVSGDFYWFEIIPNTSKLLVVCADSTGHGVPGAFMSIIGTTLLKDIYSHPDVHNPSDVLMNLDNALKNTLNQNQDGERPNDGMDIIVCEIDVKSYHVKFASAMRPFIVYQNGEQLYFKGSASSIGGYSKDVKNFECVELQLTKGDLIYMFSDGYPDQFGGPLEKKFKMVRLRNLLKDINQKPMEEQYNYIKSNFELWKGDRPQVDDVLFMGIKI
jgi:ligand-binding sensor domain-containing protein/serine phosphatase RsbU (regulator of sigma subunit)